MTPSTDQTAPAATSTPGRSAPRPWYDLGFRFTPRQAAVLLVLLVGGVLFSVAVERLIQRFVTIDVAGVDAWVERFGVFAPLAFIALLAATIIFSPLPSVPVSVAGGLAFGLVLGTVCVLAGGMLGAVVNFYVARRLGRGFLARRLGASAMAHIDDYAERMGFKLVLLTRLIPLFSFDWISYAAGLTSMSIRSYALATLIGTLPPVVAIVYVGDTLLTEPRRSAIAFAGLVAWSAIPPVVFLVWVGVQALRRRARRPRLLASGSVEARRAEEPSE